MFVDCHWHPTEYEDDRLEEKISEAKDRGVEEIIGVPLDVKSCEELLDISEWFESLHPAVGIHPSFALESTESDLEKISDSMGKSDVVATGEIGIDLHFLEEDTKEGQLRVFRKLLKSAVDQDLPVVLHCPKGEPVTYNEARKAGVEKAIFHWYTGPLDILRKILDTDGYYISVTPAVKYSGKLQKTVELADLDKMVMESDGPTEYRGVGEGEPSHVPSVAEKIAEIKNIDESHVEEITSRNARKIFQL